MKITFLGATKTVTGSNFLVEGAGKKFLVDCGMYQGKAVEELENEAPFLFDVKEIDFMLLTHAHIDHSGRIPKLYNEGFRNPIYATKATCDLCSIMLPDSGHIQEMENEWKNKKRIRKGLEPLTPLYTAEDALKSLEIFQPIKYDEVIEIDENIHVRFNDAGHMLGSAVIEVWVDEDGKKTKAVFSGDIGNNDLPLLAEPTMIEDADYLVMESTYGDRLHVGSDDKAQEFLDIVSETLNKGGTVVIPSFAVGRTQEILYELNMIKDIKASDERFKQEYETLMNSPVYVDSPLAISATEIFKKNTDLFDEETQAIIAGGNNPLEFPGLQFTRTADESKALNESNIPSIIISASGMCEVGRIKHHLKHNIWNPNSTILFVGYQAPGTLGRQIVDGAEKVKIFGEEFSVNARIEYIEGYSGHADQQWLLNFVYSFRTRPKHIFLVHGEPNGQMVLKDKIIDTTGIPVTIPSFGECYTLDDTLSMHKQFENPVENKQYRMKILDRIQDLEDDIENMKNLFSNKMKVEQNDEQVNQLNDQINMLQKKIREIIGR